MGFSIKEKDGLSLIKRSNGFYVRCSVTNDIISTNDLLPGWDGNVDYISGYFRVSAETGGIISKRASDEMVRCDVCGRFEVPNDVAEINGRKVCTPCMKRNYRRCADCGRWFRRDSGFIHDYLIDETTDPDNSKKNWKYICNDCRTNYTQCRECGALTKNPQDYRGNKVCGACYGNVLKGYHYDGNPTYGMPMLGKETRNGDILMGIELEADRGGRSNKNARIIANIMGRDYITICTDGSIHNGFELISCPANYKYHLTTLHWKEAMEKLKELGYVSHDGGSCGLHIHLDREYFGSMKKDEYEGKFFVILRNNREWIKSFSRRFSYGYCKINGYEHSYDASDDTIGKFPYPPSINWINKKKQYERHMAVNFQNEATVEIRIFRGTLNYETFVATLQMVKMWAYFVKGLSMDGCINLSLRDFVARATSLGYTEFINYIRSRHIIDDPTPTGE